MASYSYGGSLFRSPEKANRAAAVDYINGDIEYLLGRAPGEIIMDMMNDGWMLPYPESWDEDDVCECIVSLQRESVG